jgi:hypothetical protein
MYRTAREPNVEVRATTPTRKPGRMFGFSVLAVLAATAVPLAVCADDGFGAPRERRFRVVLEAVLRGDLVIAGNSNLRSAGGWRPGGAADVDGDRTVLCTRRAGFDPVCADNSSSAYLDIPRGARVVHARLYVETTVSTTAGPIRVRLDGPGRRYDYMTLGAATPGVAKLDEASGAGRDGAVLRQAIWDVTDYVAVRGRGSYTVADIVSERADAFLPYASWAIVAAYELAPAGEARWPSLPPGARQRFAVRAVSWHDGFVRLTDGSLDVPVRGVGAGAGMPAFAKSLHIVAHAREGTADNLLLNGEPIGNNLTPGAAPPPVGEGIGSARSCNSTTDVFNETICVLGAPVRTKRPGHRAFRASSDGVTRSSGSGVDIDVIRIPDRYLPAWSSTGVLTVRPGDEPLAPGMLAVSVDVPQAGR